MLARGRPIAKALCLPKLARLLTLSTLLLAFSISVGLLALGATPVSAHANLVRSRPEANEVLVEPPGELRLWFSEAPEPRFSSVQLLNSSGRKVDAIGPLQPDPQDAQQLVAPLEQLQPGVYTVAWRATSKFDGHVTAGSFAFAVGQEQGPAITVPKAPLAADLGGAGGPTLPETVNRWLSYLALSLLTGVFAFFLFVLRPALAEISQASRVEAEKGREARPAPAIMPRRPLAIPAAFFSTLWLGAGLGVATTVVGAMLQAAAGANVGFPNALGSPLLTLLSDTLYGLLFWIRLLLFVLLLVLLATGRSWARQPSVARQFWRIGLELSALILLATSLNGHAAASPSPILTTVADWLHLTAASIWVGGLVALAIALPWIGRTHGPIFAPAVSSLTTRFSLVATVCVIILGLTGVYRAILEVVDWANLLDTPYGNALLVKLILLLPLLGLGAVNLLLIKSRMAAANRAATPSLAVQPWYQLIRRTVGGEILIVLALLLTTSILVNQQPARDAFGSSAILRGAADDLRVVLAVNPGQPGLNSFDIYVRDDFGRGVTEVDKVALIFKLTDQNLGETEAVAESDGDGRYVTQGGYVSVAGTWQVQVLVRRSGRDDVRVPLTFVPDLASGAVAPQIDVAAMASFALSPLWVVFGLLSISAGAALRDRQRGPSQVMLAIGLVMMLITFAISVIGIFVSLSDASVVSVPQNPVRADAASIARGQIVYERNCLQCHGAAGLGDGPSAQKSQPRPGPLQDHIGLHSDGEFYLWITNGIEGTTMPSYARRLSEQERWDVVNYIWTFGSR